MSLLNELKRRNVFRVGAAYLVVAWLVIQVAETIFPLFGFDDSPARIIVTILSIGFIPVVVLAWAFELTPDGLKKEKDVDRSQSITPHTGKKLDRIILVMLALALGYFTFDKFVLDPARDAELVEETTQKARSDVLVESYGDKSIAVLPFVDMSPEGDQDYFSDGIAEELLNLLAKIPELRVISRSSAFSYKGKDINLAQVAEELKVAHILEGSVRKSGDRLRITAQLIEAHSDTHLWSETYDRTLNDIFAIQDEIANKVVGQLKISLLGEVPRVEETDPVAYALYLQAMYLLRVNSPESVQEAVMFLDQVLSIDPNFVPAMLGHFICYDRLETYGELPKAEAQELALRTVENALAIAPNSADALQNYAWHQFKHYHDLQLAAKYFERALALEPTNISIIGNVSLFLSSIGKQEDSIRLAEYQVSRDPTNAVAYNNLGLHYRYAGHFSKAEDVFLTGLRLSPSFSGLHYELGATKLLTGDFDAALSEFEKESISVFKQIGKAMVFHAQGEQALSANILSELISSYGERIAYYIAQIMAYQGDLDGAFNWLNKAKLNDDSTLREIMNEPLFGNLHTDSRWLPFLASIGKAPEQLDEIRFEVTLSE